MTHVTAERRNEQDRTQDVAQLSDVRQLASKARVAVQDAARLAQQEITKEFAAISAQAGAAASERHEADPAAAIDKLARGQQLEADLAARVVDRINGLVAGAAERLEQRQQADRSAITDRPSSEQAELAQHHEQQVADLRALAGRAQKVAEDGMSDLRNRQADEAAAITATTLFSDEQRAAQHAATAPDAPLLDRNEEMRRIDEEQSIGLRASVRTLRRLESFVRAESEAIVNRSTPEQMRAVRARTNITADQLDDGALDRVLQAVRGKAREDRTLAVDAMRGQLAEELNHQRVDARLLAEGDRRETYVAGDRIRDGWGRKLSDGMVVREDEGARAARREVYEVKASADAARSFFENLSLDRSREIQNYAHDLAVAEIADEERVKNRQLSGEAAPQAALAELAKQREALVGEAAKRQYEADLALARGDTQALEARTRQKIAQLSDPSVQVEGGQWARTRERVDQQRLFIDGQEREQTEVDQEKLARQVRLVVPADTVIDAEHERDLKERGVEVERLEQTEQWITDRAEELADQLDEWGND